MVVACGTSYVPRVVLVFFAMHAAAAAAVKAAITCHYTAVAVLLDMIAIGYLEQETGNLSKVAW